MWIVIVLIVGIIIWFVVKSNSSSSLPNARTSNYASSEALGMIRDLFKDLSQNQRYAVYNFFDSLAQCVISYPAKQKAQERVKIAAVELNINPSTADARMQTYGLYDMFSNLGSIPKGAALDSIIATAYGISLMASGTIQGRDAKLLAQNIFIGSLSKAGFSEDYITESLEKTAAIMNTFCG